MKQPKPQDEVLELRARLAEAEETLHAIQHGEVDALVVSGPEGEKIYTLQGADFSSRLLLQEMNEGALTLLPEGPILYCNKRFASIVQLPHEQIIGVAFDRLIAPGDRDAFQALIRQTADGGAKGEIHLIAGDGTLVPTCCSVSLVPVDHRQCLCVIVTDLTEQKRNEEILASGALAHSILKQADEIIVVCDGSGTIIEASRATHEFAGRNVLREPFDEVFPIATANGARVTCSSDQAAGEILYLRQCLAGQKFHGVEVRLRRPDGKKCDFLMSAGPLNDFQEQVRGCVFTFSDISKLKQAEEALRGSEQRLREQARQLEQQLIASGRLVSLGEITASMAHEFNNPLGIIMGFVEDMLGGADPNNPDYQSLQIIDEETRRCQKIIQGLMDFARPGTTAPRLTDIGGLIAKTLQMIDARLYKQKVTLVKSISPDLPQVYVDPQQLEQVLVNLYLNALDAMLGGGNLMILAAPDPASDADPKIVITVADNGMGIDESDLQKIFQPFFTARKKAGLGLGLSICERIVKNHSGTIEVQSTLKHGSVFRIRLPVNPPLG